MQMQLSHSAAFTSVQNPTEKNKIRNYGTKKKKESAEFILKGRERKKLLSFSYSVLQAETIENVEDC